MLKTFINIGQLTLTSTSYNRSLLKKLICIKSMFSDCLGNTRNYFVYRIPKDCNSHLT